MPSKTNKTTNKNKTKTLLSLTENLRHIVISTRFYVPSCYRSCNSNLTLFQQDNARPHTARVVQQFFDANNVNVLPWPARSPDLSPIEHLFYHLGQWIRRRPNPPMKWSLGTGTEAGVEGNTRCSHETLNKLCPTLGPCLHMVDIHVICSLWS